MKKRYIWWILFSVVVIGLGIFLTRIGISRIVGLIFKAQISYLLYSLLFLFLAFGVWNYIWTESLKLIKDKDFSFFYTFPLYFVGALFNNLTPGAKVGGEPIRAYYLAQEYGGKKSTYLAGIVYQSLLDYIAQFGFLIFSLIVLISVFSYSKVETFFTVIVSLVVFIGISIIVLYFSREKIESLIRKLSFLYRFLSNRFDSEDEFEEYLVNRYNNFLSKLKLLFKSPGRSIFLLILSFLGRLLFFLSVYFVFLSLQVEFSFLYVIITSTFMLFFAEISGLPGGVGIAEGSLILLYSLFGLSGVQAGAISLLSRATFYFYTIFIGFVCFIYLKFKEEKLS